MANLLAEIGPTHGDDHFRYWSYRDLQARRIVATRTDLHRKQRFYGFPRPVVLTGGVGAAALYRVAEVKAWLVQREALATQNSAPALKENSRPRGRPRKNQILADSPPG